MYVPYTLLEWDKEFRIIILSVKKCVLNGCIGFYITKERSIIIKGKHSNIKFVSRKKSSSPIIHFGMYDSTELSLCSVPLRVVE